MPRRPQPDALNTLRFAIQEPKQPTDPDHDAAALAAIKRILETASPALEISKRYQGKPNAPG